jgi:bifunctional non-homologous end joining protein LigD
MVMKRRPARRAQQRTGEPDPPVAPQLATLVSAVPTGDAWLHEIKFDGYRLIAVLHGRRVRLFTRNGKDWTERFGVVADALARLPVREAVVDGEIVVMRRDGVTSFQALQNWLSAARGELLYYLFDVLELDGEDLRQLPLEERKERLAGLLAGCEDPLRYSDHVAGRGESFYREACAHGLEGIISKRRDAVYRSGRTREWLKVKCGRNQEFVVVGYTQPRGSRAGLGALALAAKDAAGELRYVGRVGTGFTGRQLGEMRRILEGEHAPSPPVRNVPRGRQGGEIRWVVPRLVVEVSFTDWTDDGVLRHPSFRGLREDKTVDEIWIEKPEPAARRRGDARGPESMEVSGVRLTNPHKVLYKAQGITKLDLARYYEAVADWMLPHVAGRPLTLLRCPAGPDGQCFYQKHLDASAAASIRRVRVEEEAGAQPYGAVDTAAGLVALVQMGVLEIHTWGSRRDRLEQPDRLTFDLDPDEGLAWSRVMAAAHEVREFLSHLGLDSFLKTTGGKGLHLVVPIRRKDGWDDVKEFARRVAMAIASDAPGRYTTTISKAKRKGRILIDYLRNGRGSTAIEAFSTRARAGAPVAAPIRWEELTPKLRSDRFDVRSMPRRLASLRADPWADYAATRQAVTARMKRAVGMR